MGLMKLFFTESVHKLIDVIILSGITGEKVLV